MQRALFLTLALFFTVSASAETILKYATLAPENTLWARVIKRCADEIEQQTKGEIKLRVFYGGIAGDEPSVMRKLRSGTIDIASFTGQTLGTVVSEVRIFELPFFFENTRQIDAVRAALYPDLAQKFLAQGLVLAGLGENGFVYLMSKNKPISRAADMQGVKIWAPKGDPLVRAMLAEYGLVPVYLGFEAVLPQLKTGGIDAFYAPPYGAIGLQWFREANYLTNARLANAIGATLIAKTAFDKLSAAHKKIVQAALEKSARELTEELRRENEKSLEVLLNKGIRKVEPNPEDLAQLKATALRVQDKLVGELYPKELLAKARRARDAVK
ncbi:MAG: TRAP transporter substrate-binding protein DctP [Turneriella sp.]|nr:TRAP transporter substrate-binding protein DctP [Leptospiraceae bacterium]MCX7632692.1 TRAP transporter substrate-binding protein DctP [Turneriella sp.]